jgi:L-ascorbate metabolism protein UlaG (beta-lactamase superfamily)
MQVTIFGHASLYIETSDQKILLDPFFADDLVEGTLVFNPARTFDLEQMPIPTILVVTHGHFDHFHLESLQKFSRNTPLITSDDPPVIKQLVAAGFSNVIVCHPWQSVQFGKTSLLPTPSEHEEEEIGLLIQNEGCSFWHIADSEVNIGMGKQLVERCGSIDLISAKYQPSVDPMMGYSRNMGAAFDKYEFVTWLETACECEPSLVFPYASGICFNGRHEWFNRYAFPFSEAEVVNLFQQRLGDPERATSVLPGDVIEWEAGTKPQKHLQAAPFVRTQTSSEIRWEPVDNSTLSGLEISTDRENLQQQLETFLTETLIGWLQRQFNRQQSGWEILFAEDIIWQLVVHLGDGERFNYYMDFRSPQVDVFPGTHPESNFYTHISGRTLYEVLQEKVPGIVLWLTGSVRSYEKIVGVRNGKFSFPNLPSSPKFHLCDPLTYYLRHFGTGSMAPDEPDMEIDRESEQPTVVKVDPMDVEAIARRGGNSQVLSKKALLTYLSIREAERIGLEVTEADTQDISDTFRIHFGLLDPQVAQEWIEKSGLTIESYALMMQHLATVIKLEQKYLEELQPLLVEHNRIATAQSVVLT